MPEELTLQKLKSYLWESANILRGSIDAADFKNYILGMLFFKRLSDVYDEEYERLLKKVVTEHIFPGWQVQPSVHATIKRDIIFELVKYAKEHTEVDLNPDDYSKFSQEAMKYVEKHF